MHRKVSVEQTPPFTRDRMFGRQSTQIQLEGGGTIIYVGICHLS